MYPLDISEGIQWVLVSELFHESITEVRGGQHRSVLYFVFFFFTFIYPGKAC